MKKVVVATYSFVMMGFLACGGATPPPAEPTQPAPSDVTAPDEAPGGESPGAEAASDPAGEEPKEAAKPPRGPMATYDQPTGPVTVGLDGAVISSGGAELRVPPGALHSPRNVVFLIDRKSRGNAGKLGEVYSIEVQIPDRQVQMGEARPSQPEPTASDPFVLKLPLPAGRDSANLAVESVAVDDKGRGKSTWIVMAMTKPETADTGNRAVFEMANLPDAHVHLTTAPAGQ